MRPPPRCWPTPGQPSRWSPDGPGVWTMSTGGRAPGTCSWPANPWRPCDRLRRRHVAVTGRRTAVDFAHQMRWLVDEAYPDVPVVRLVLDNLNTHRKASLYQAFPAAEARRIAKRLEFHFTPKHGSWLNPVLSLPKGWRRSSSASSPAVASGSVSRTRQPSAGKYTPWNWSEMRLKPASTGVSASRTPELNSIACIPSIPNLIEY